MRRLLSVLFIAIAFWVIAYSASAYAADLQNGEKLFNANCSACHMGGNNVIISSKTLKKDALKKYDMFSLEAIEKQVTNGKNAMPSFRSRLNPAQIEDVAAFVLNQSEKGW